MENTIPVNNTTIIIIIISVIIVIVISCCLSSILGIFNGLFVNKAISTPSPTDLNPLPGQMNPITPKIPTIKFCSLPNLQGTCKSYDLTYTYYPISSECGTNPIGFKPQSISIDNDDPSKYKLSIRGYFGNTNDTNCGPSQVPLNATPSCYNSNIYGIVGDRGSCIPDSASGVSWISNNVNGGINIEK